MSESFGIMDGGYFVPRGEILKWINQVLKLDLTHIEQLASGAVYCQLLDAMCPGLVPMHKLNWKARTQYEFMQNLKVLQFVFDRVGMTKKLDIMKLAKIKYQDNLEFIQWFKRFLESQGGCKEDYDAEGRRGGAQVDLSFAGKKPVATKQNLKKTPSVADLQKSPIDFKKHCTELAAQNINKLPRTRTLSYLGTVRGTPDKKKELKESEQPKIKDLELVKREPPKKNLSEPKKVDKITKIKEVLKTARDTQKQIDQIRKILEVQKIEEEDD